MTRDEGLRIPVHVVTGFLGSGKSSAIRHLIDNKPSGERWAILINEFGQVGIDQAMFEERREVVVKGLPGGCLCCQLAFVLQASLISLLQRSRPDRLIIEPSGLGHPAGLLDLLRGEAFRDVLEVRDVIALLDPRRLSDPRTMASETFHDQLSMADGVALTMTDLASGAQCDDAYRHLDGLWPAKRWVVEAPHGAIEIQRLVGARTSTSGLIDHLPEPVPGHDRPHDPSCQDPQRRPMVELDIAYREPLPGSPVRDSGQTLGHASTSWRWHADELFDLDKLTRVLDALPSAIRVKGIWHTAGGWYCYNRGDGRAELSGSSWRRDSRLEVIVEQGALPDGEALEARLADCLLNE
ncbi:MULTISPECIES: GTP-binding protein [Halomonadaceae]|uniref:CobW family GTP-binding protein n=1 Tax=Halomonadaceae TaxID=28256 RepID=UPI001598632F|nr:MULTISPECIES: GTP-binding protein [Halomonas]QJQ94368.1 GTP-binding protein [Halomonas sp. PA5]